MPSFLQHFPYQTIRDFQQETLELLEKHWDHYDVFAVIAPTACHARGQKVIMYDGTLKAVENIKVGDRLMGPDSNPRTVLELFHGQDMMMRVTPQRGTSFDVTHNHILSLRYYKRHGGYKRASPRYFTQELITKTVSDWNNSSKSHKHCTKLWKPEQIDFKGNKEELSLPAYFLGTWLGDGSSDKVAITNMDEAILNYWAQVGTEYGLNIRDDSQENNRAITRNLSGSRGHKNPLLDKLRFLGVLNNKHIPHQYLTSSYESRLELLAGIIDTDGHVLPRMGSIEIVQKNQQLLNDIAFLARSLGFAVGKVKIKTVNGVPYYRIFMSSQRAEDLPLLVPHKKEALLNSKSNQRNDGIKKVEELGVQEYFGFELDGDHLYLLEDFTVTHNTGKTAISKTLLNALYGASYIVPNNMLVSQMTDSFSDTRTLHRMDSYRCEEWKRPCSATRARLKSFCKGCQCSSDLATAKYRKGPGVYNYHTYMAHKLYRSTLVVDEAHLLVPMLQQMGEVVLWQHDYKYPLSAYRPDQILAWAEKLPPKKQKTVKVELLLEQLRSSFPAYSVARSVREFNGKGTTRGQPEDRDCIVITPLSAKDKAGVMWPRGEVSKIVLLSATIGAKDIESLGLSERRVAYIHSPSPIAPNNRPFHYWPVTAVTRATLHSSVPKLAQEITRLAQRHKGQRGLVHATYQLSEMLRPHLADSRYLFHDKWNKKEQYEKYLNTPGSILVACGLYEGINLPDDLGRWQVLTKIPWPSLGDPAIKAMAERDEEWYLWQTAKTVIQAAGRICRHENDYGITYCLDSTFKRLYDSGQHLLPQWFQDCLRQGDIP